MALTGRMLIGRTALAGKAAEFHALNPSTGSMLEPVYGGADRIDIARACELAWAAFDAYRETSGEVRASFLETIGAHILDCGDALITRAMEETGLPRGRLEGERGRTVGQLRLFAQMVREGSFVEARIDPALPQRTPLARADLRQRHIALGPVAVFGASNFPLAFSVAGGDTASAFAAGCPVIVKAHNAHLGTSELVGQAVQSAVADCGLPEGVFSLLFGAGNDVGIALVADPRIKAVGFTGSRAAGTALMAAAARRPEPIPVYAEMSSINPVYLLPAALAARGAAIAKSFVASLTLGAGQFCTNPGLVIAMEGSALETFIAAVAAEINDSPAGTMLTPGIHRAFDAGVRRLATHSQVAMLAQGKATTGPHQGRPAVFSIRAAHFLAEDDLQEEVFGAACLLVRCRDFAELRNVAEGLQGQLTATLQLDADDVELARELIPTLERQAGRILVNGFPTGVEVCHAMVHGGPYPSTSDGRSTSVGTLAVRRFMRPVCYQDFPAALLPRALADGNPLAIWRLFDGQLGKT